MTRSGVGPSGSHVHGEGIVVVGDSDLERSLSGIVRKVGDEVGGQPGSAVVFAADRDVDVFTAILGGVVWLSEIIEGLIPEDEDVLLFGVRDSLESGENIVSDEGKRERSGDGDESGRASTEAHRAGGVDGVGLDKSLRSTAHSELNDTVGANLSGPVRVSYWCRCRSVGGTWCRVISILGKRNSDQRSDQFHR